MNTLKHLLCPIFLVLLSATTGESQTWVSITPISHARCEARAAILPNGHILLVGGKDDMGPLSSCEEYDPLKDTWSVGPDLHIARYRFDLEQLKDGRLLVMGGLIDLNRATTASCELFDPAMNTWTSLTDLPSPSENIATVILPDSTLFVTGGLNANVPSYNNFATVFDPRSESFTRYPDMPISLDGHLAFYLPQTDQVIVAGGLFGGFSGYYLTSTQRFSWNTFKWDFADSSVSPHDNGQLMAVSGKNGTPFLISGRDGPNSVTSVSESYDPYSGKWHQVGSTARPHWHCYNFCIGQDSVLLVGGATDPANLANVDNGCTWFNLLSSNSWAGPSMISSRHLYAAVKRTTFYTENPCSHTEQIFVIGGQDSVGTFLSSCERLDLGIKSNLTEISITPSKLQAQTFSSCFAIDTSITLVNMGCGMITLLKVDSPDSILSLQLNSQFPYSIASKGSLVMKLLIRQSKSGDVSSGIRFTFSTSTGIEYKYLPISGASERRRTRFVSGIETYGDVCSGMHYSVVLNNGNCDSLKIDSVILHLPFSLASSVDSLKVIRPMGLDSITGSILSNAAGIFPYNIHVYAHFANLQIDTTLVGFLTFQNNLTYNTQILLKDALNVTPGDTVTLPLIVYNKTDVVVDNYRINVEFDPNLLEILDPGFDGTLSSSATFDDINRSSSGASLFVPHSVTLTSGKTLLNLRFKTFVSPNPCSSIKLLSVSFGSSLSSNCILSTNLDSATVCLKAGCGDALLRALMRNDAISIDKISVSGGVLKGTYSCATGMPMFSVYNVMGDRLSSVFGDGARRIAMPVADLAAGTYFLRMENRGHVVTRRFSITR